MAVEGALVDSETGKGLYVGADHLVYYTDADDPPTNMAGWTVVLDIRKSDMTADALVSVIGVVSGTYSSVAASNTQQVTFTLTDDDLAATKIKGEDPTLRYSIKRVNAGAEGILRYGDCIITRVTQV